MVDLLERINSLTDDQLQMVAERDDASGVLAAYRLAELRGLPYPDRETVILGDGYAIVARDGVISRVAVESVQQTQKIIREENGEFCVYSEDGSRSFGCYPTMGEAQERLAQIHHFADEKQVIREGTFVSWNASGGRARGQVEHVMTEGILGIPGSEFQINAEPDDPAVLIRIWRQFADGWKATDTLVGHKMSTLTRIDALKAFKIIDGESYPPAAFAYTPNLRRVSTWEIKLWEDSRSGPTPLSVQQAIAEFLEADIPEEDLPRVKHQIRAAYVRAHGDDKDIPASIAAGEAEKESFSPPQGVQDAAQRALDWIAEGHAGSGFTDVGRARAAQLARGQNVSEDTIRRMRSYFARHEVDQQATGWNAGEDGFPSPGRVAWDAWGGDAGKTWAETIVARLDREQEKNTCPRATQNVLLNLMNRKTAIDVAMYGPLDPSEPNEDYWQGIADEWEIPIEEAKSARCGNCAAFDISSQMKECISEGIESDSTDDTTPDPMDVVDAGELGYCRVFKFKCAAARTCSAWIEGGPITDNTVEETKSLSKAFFLKKQAEKRFTLGPLYVPDFMDAHGEWTDADELQPAVWEWVRSGDRRIFLQHDRDIEAGEWVEVMTMPQSWTVEMMDANGEAIGEVTYPPNTTFLGVIWNEEAWEMIKAGQLRGYSIGGFSDRVLADLPYNGEREGLDMPRVEEAEPVDLAKSIAAAVADAMKQAQPVVNVVMPEAKATKVRRIERDEHGNIARIIEEED